MAIAPKIKHIDQLANGVLRFRRRFPKDVSEHIGESFLQVHIRNTEGLPFHREYQAILEDFDRMVAKARAEMDRAGIDNRTTQQKWHDALLSAAGLKEGVIGLDPEDPETAHIILDTMKIKPDPLVTKALINPSAKPPAPTLRDAVILYREDNSVAEGSRDDVELTRIIARLEDALGPLNQIAMSNLSRKHGRAYVKHMLSLKKADGSPLSVGSSKREAGIIRAIVTHGIREMDIDVSNHFKELHWPKQDETALEKKQPLPDELVPLIKTRLKGARNKELHLIWTILASTGARLGEIAGLTLSDVVLDTDVPHMLIRPNAVRGLKTKSSVRSVPLTVPAQDALRQAVRVLGDAGSDTPVFGRYARPRGNDSLSAVLMKNVRTETKDKKITVHGLRHRVSDKLREVGAPTEVRQGFLGHANQAIAESTYGSPQARLKEFAKWAEKASL